MTDLPVPPPSLNFHFAEEIAQAIAALINAHPRSPTREELRDAIVKGMADHWLVTATHPSIYHSEGTQKTEAYLRGLWDAVIAEYEEIAQRPNFAATAVLAKKLCALRHGNDSLYTVTMGIPGGHVMMTANSTAALCFPLQPQWACFVREAQDALAAMSTVASPPTPH